MTSSISMMTPFFFVASRTAWRKPGGSGAWPHDAPEGSNITAAMSSRSSISFTTAATLSLGITMERALTSCGTPGVVPPS
jgi:hypothetical protein